MDAVVSLADVANIVTFVAPGYFALQVYSLAYAKRDRDFSRLVLESIVYSLPIVALANLVWRSVLMQDVVTTVNAGYAVLVLALAVLAGWLATLLRNLPPFTVLARRLGLGSPDEDFVRSQLVRIDAKDPDNNAVVVRLKSGQVFSGTVDRLSRYVADAPRYYHFANLAWLDRRNRWVEADGGIIVERSEIEYIELPRLKR